MSETPTVGLPIRFTKDDIHWRVIAYPVGRDGEVIEEIYGVGNYAQNGTVEEARLAASGKLVEKIIQVLRGS